MSQRRGLPEPQHPGNVCMETMPAGEPHHAEGVVRIAYNEITGERLDRPVFRNVCADCAHDYYSMIEFLPYLND